MAEITFYDVNGMPVAYLDDSDEQTIYMFSGEPVAYAEESHVYGFNGVHLGWFEEGVLWDHSGYRVGATREVFSGFAHSDPFKKSKHFKPARAYKQTPPYMPSRSFFSDSDMAMYDWLLSGRS